MTYERIHSNEEWPEWLHEAWNRPSTIEGALYLAAHTPRRLAIQTLEGAMHVTPNDWIIRGTEGELYPCKPEVFAKKYVPA